MSLSPIAGTPSTSQVENKLEEQSLTAVLKRKKSRLHFSVLKWKYKKIYHRDSQHKTYLSRFVLL